MAKAIERPSLAPPADSAGITLAERLFATHWNPKSGFETTHVAKLCLEAAEIFERVQRERAELRISEAA